MKYVIAILLILFASYADIFLYRIGIAPAEPSKFFIPLFLGLCLIKYSIHDFWDLLKSHSFKFLVAVLLFSVVYAAISPGDLETIKTDIFLNIITIFIYIFAVHFFRTENKKLVFIVMFFALLSIGGSVTYDFFIGLPKFNIKLSEALRKGGFGENPNQAASAIKFLALGCLVLIHKQKNIRILIISIMVISVFLTLSRSGFVSVVLILIFGSINNWEPKFHITAPKFFKRIFTMGLLFTSLFFALVLFSNVIKENFPGFTRGTAGARIDMLTGQGKGNVIAEDIGSGGGRGDLLLMYFDKFKENPFGYGTEYTGAKRFNDLNTHNYYLFLAVNFGFLALILYLIYLFQGFNLAIRKEQFYYIIFLILLVFEGLISHSIFYERSLLISLAFFDSLIYKNSLES